MVTTHVNQVNSPCLDTPSCIELVIASCKSRKVRYGTCGTQGRKVSSSVVHSRFSRTTSTLHGLDVASCTRILYQ